MSRPKNPIPTMRRHKASNRAFVIVNQKTVYLGPWKSKAAHEEYRRVVARLAAGRPAAFESPTGEATVNEVVVAYIEHADRYYPPTSSEPPTARLAAKPLVDLFGRTPAAEFGPLRLQAVRDVYVKTLARSEVNRRTGALKRMFKWAVANELVPPSVHHGLLAVSGLKRGRTAARETAPVLPVADADVDAVLPFVAKPVQGLIEFQRLTGCRPGEACTLRMADVDTSGDVWVCRPESHKNAYRGKSRSIAIGPKCQELLRQHMPADPSAYVFSPKAAVEAFHADRSGKRVTPKYASHMRRNKAKRVANPTRPPGERFTTGSYGRAVLSGIAKARAAGVELKDWHLNQLRHSHATAVRKQFGLEGVLVALGHERANTTEIYAEKNLDLAKRVAAAMG